ncbi:hypothetical protein JB92DRAFT_3149848 [Gautieria morchelliformis]|nr:hypothetical protein JB92DRAFT_3149848 [Gautieria morchelliformis]
MKTTDMSTVDLPVELWRLIIARVPEKDALASLSQVSHVFHLEAERFLYCAIILTHDDDALSKALRVSCRRALLVEECTLYLPPSSTAKASASSPSSDILSLLSGMHNLRSLSLRGHIPASLTCSYSFHLRTFCTTEILSPRLVAFLRAQPDIRHLSLLNPKLTSTPSLTDALPNAHDLATLTPAPAFAILPHLTVTHLDILAWGNASIPDVHPTCGAFRALHALHARDLRLTPPDLNLIANHMPNLTFIGDISFKGHLSEYLTALSRLPLRTLVINHTARSNSVSMLELACRDLEHVVFTKLIYVRERGQNGSNAWRTVPVGDRHEVTADLWRTSLTSLQ